VTDLIRLSVNMNTETAAALKEMADSGGRSLTETVRRCIAITKFIKDERLAGNRIQIVDTERNEVRELILT
jgi:hypothetical protein